MPSYHAVSFYPQSMALVGTFAIVLAAYAFNIKLAVLYNDWNGRFFNALQAVNRDAIF